MIALRPDRDDRRVVASAGNGAIRAAISVAVAAGNRRAWDDVRDGSMTTVAVATLPEVIRAAVEPSILHVVRVGAVRIGDDVVCMTMWLSTTADAAIDTRHADLLARLARAAEADAAAAFAVAAARVAATGDREGGGVIRASSGAALAALPDRTRFEMTLDALNVDEAALVVFGIDDVDQLSPDALTSARETVAERLAESLRKCDVIGYVDDDTFAVLLANVDRRQAFEISRRLRGSLSDGLSISVGLAHEDGLIDPVEMFESATSAMHDARLEGGARMLIAC